MIHPKYCMISRAASVTAARADSWSGSDSATCAITHGGKGRVSVGLGKKCADSNCDSSLPPIAILSGREGNLACNVIVHAHEAPGKSVAATIDPMEALALTGGDNIRPVAEETRVRLERVLKAVSE
jgi:hypothetical protein